MLFIEKELRSQFDLDCELSDDMATLNFLCKEIQKTTNILGELLEKDYIVKLRYIDNNGNSIFIDKSKISEKTWYRDISEIRNILYRNEVDGREQNQFSIGKALKDFGIEKPEDSGQYKEYLKLQYFFYMINYFVFPDKNIFKFLSENNASYTKTYDEGADEGKYLTFIIGNILANKDEFRKFIEVDKKISVMMEEISLLYKTYSEYELVSIEKIRKNIEADIGNNPLSKMWFFCYKYTIKSYCYDILQNLEKGEENLIFDPMEIGPFEKWKNLYVPIENVDDFLHEDEIYRFVKQRTGKIESRDKIKFIESNSIKNFKYLVDYDLQWMKDFGVDEGLFLNKGEDGKIYIYALKIAIIIKTYNDLVNIDKLKIKRGKKEKEQPLRTALHATLPIRLFMLGCHSQYLNATQPRGVYKLRFLDEFLYPEMETMHTIMAIFE